MKMSMMYIIFKSLSHNLYFLACVTLAVFLLVRKNHSSTSRLLRIGALVFFWLLGTRPVAELALRPLENAYSVPSIDWLEQWNLSD